MEQILENPRLDAESLRTLRAKIQANTAIADEYRTIDSFLSNYGLDDYLKNILKERNVFSFEEYIEMRRSKDTNRARLANGELLGTITGVLEGLEKFLIVK